MGIPLQNAVSVTLLESCFGDNLHINQLYFKSTYNLLLLPIYLLSYQSYWFETSLFDIFSKNKLFNKLFDLAQLVCTQPSAASLHKFGTVSGVIVLPAAAQSRSSMAE